MGFVFTLVYLAFAIVSIASLFPELAGVRLQLFLALLALVVSVPAMARSRLWRSPQIYFLIALAIAIAMSSVVNGWAGGALNALGNFLPSAVAFPLLVVNVRSLARARVLVVTLLLIACSLIIAGAYAYYHESYDGEEINAAVSATHNSEHSRLIMPQATGDTTYIKRFRGLGIISDPNDTAQFLVCLLPFLWIGWRSHRYLPNVLFVIAPAALLLFGIYLTHSRGAVIALLVMCLFALRRRLGNTRAMVAAAVLAAVFIVVGFTGGRDISVNEGSDRIGAWSQGIMFVRSSPVFGIGYGNFADQYEITAHNSFILCAAEIGLVGYFFWLAIIVFTWAGLTRADARLIVPDDDDVPESHEMASVQQWAHVTQASLLGFLAAAWFLSRAYTTTLYILLGLALALTFIFADLTGSAVFANARRLTLISAALVPASLITVYALVRIGHLL